MAARVPGIDRLIEGFGRLPGIGPKTAERLTYHLLAVPEAEALQLASAIEELRSSTAVCTRCYNVDVASPCSICQDVDRDRRLVLVVEDPRDVGRFEETGYKGLYYVLQGRVSQHEGIAPDDLTTAALLDRVRRESPEEVCLATNPDLEGEGTAQLIGEQLAELGVRVTRLARGLPAGSNITQVSRSILADAVEGRRPM